MSSNLGIPTRESNYADWYNELVVKADLADYSPVRGCMIIPPHGFALWENMQRALDDMIKETGHQNAYFPLLIPKSFFDKEADHVEGFAKECAVVTHHRLTKSADGKSLIPDPEAELEEPPLRSVDLEQEQSLSSRLIFLQYYRCLNQDLQEHTQRGS